MLPKLTASAIQERLHALPHWRLSANGTAIERHYLWRDFEQSLAFMIKSLKLEKGIET